jgi:Ca-activated chloride channel family protein
MNISASTLTVSFVNDYSGSMSTSALQAMETAVKTFIGYMKTSDRGEYIAFGANIVPKTSGFVNPSTLENSIGGSGVDDSGTALYDAIHFALERLQGESSDRVRAVIALTDGGDNSSGKTMQNIIDKAKQLSVPVFTIGLGSSIERVKLQKIADDTGGNYYEAPNKDDLEEIYKSLIEEISGRAYLM